MPTPPVPPVVAELNELLASYRRHLRAAKVSPNTIRTYGQSINALVRFLTAMDDPPADITGITREHLQDWVIGMVEANPESSTPLTRFTQARTFFLWLVAEGELEESPTKGMRDPKVTVKPVPVVAADALRAILDTCGNDFDGRRDEALLRAYADGGLRLSECVRLELADVDMDQQVFWVVGKGDRQRAVPFGAKTARALDRYLRARRRHAWADESARLWLGRKGPLTGEGVRWMLERRAKAAGLGHIHPHQLRHTAAHELSMAGMSDRDMKRIFGWRSDKMLARYGESAADERAREAHRRLSFGDRL